MSDPFAPLPLPGRPVYQEADIVERGAQATTRDLETRFAEFKETGRREMQRSREQAQEQYRADVKTADMDYQGAVNNPIRDLISSLPQLALGIYRDIQDSNREAYLVQENGRQSSMLLAGISRFNGDVRTIMSEMQLEGLGFDEVQEMLVEAATSITGSLRWSGDAKVDAPFQSQWRNLIHTQMERSLNAFHQIHLDNTVEVIAGESRAAVQEFISAYSRGDPNAEDDLARLVKSSPALESTDKPRGWVYEALTNAKSDLLASYGEQQFINYLTTIYPSDIEHEERVYDTREARLQALEDMRDHELWTELEARWHPQLDGGDFQHKKAEGKLNKFVNDEIENQAELDLNLRSALQAASLLPDNPYLAMTGRELSDAMKANGFTDAEAIAAGQRRNAELSEATQDQHDLVGALAREAKEDLWASVELSLLQQLYTDPVLMTAQEWTNTVSQLMGNGSIEKSPEKLKWYQAQYQAVAKGQNDRYQPEREYLNSVMTSLEGSATMIGGVPYLRAKEGRQLVPLSTIKHALLLNLQDAIEHGVEIQGPDGNVARHRFTSTRPLGDDEPGGMMNYLEGNIRKAVKPYELRGIVGRIFGSEESLPTSLQEMTGGRGRIASDPAMATSGPMVGAAFGTGRAIVELTGSQVLLDRFDRSPMPQQTSIALSTIPLELHTPGQTVEEAGETMSNNMQLLNEYVIRGLIHQVQVDPTAGAFVVQLVPGGNWYPMIRESQTIKARAADISMETEKLVDLLAAETDALILLDGDFTEIDDPSGSGRSITVPTLWTRAVGGQMEKLAATLAENIPYLWSYLNEIYSFNEVDSEVLQRAVQGAVPYGVQR